MSVNKVIISDDALVNMYVMEMKSLPEISSMTGIPKTAVRNILLKHLDKLRSRKEAIGLVRHKISCANRGKKKTFSEQHKINLRKALNISAEKRSSGLTIKTTGYLEITRGKNKFKSAHILVMETFLGRVLNKSEVVHHIDHDKLNNDIDNLCLLTRKGHGRLHRFEDFLLGIKNIRDSLGRLTGEIENG